MKFNEFQKKMPKAAFKAVEAVRLAWEADPKTVLLQLHQWARAGNLLRLKRGIYTFPDRDLEQAEVARLLYEPAYISLESAIHYHGLIPDVPFALTLVTPKATRQFSTPRGRYVYRHIQARLFSGFDPETLMAVKEKAVVDFFYLESGRLSPTWNCFDELRWQNLDTFDFKKADLYAKKTGVQKVKKLTAFFKTYAKT